MKMTMEECGRIAKQDEYRRRAKNRVKRRLKTAHKWSAHPKVLHWDDEREIGNSLIVTLRPGWAFWPSEDERSAEHVKGFDTVADAAKAIQRSEPCKCGRCAPKKERDPDT